jgi:hypothetical protein
VQVGGVGNHCHSSSQNGNQQHISKHGAPQSAAGTTYAATGTVGTCIANSSRWQWRHMLLRQSVDLQPDYLPLAERTRRLSLGDKSSRRSFEEPKFHRRSLEAMAEHHPQLFQDAERQFGFNVPSLQPDGSPDQCRGRQQPDRSSLTSDTQQGGRSSLSLDIRERSMVGRESSWFQSIREHSASRAGQPWFV